MAVKFLGCAARHATLRQMFTRARSSDSVEIMAQPTPRSIRRDNIPELRRALRKARSQLKTIANQPPDDAKSTRELTAAAAILAWLARTGPPRWPPSDWDPSSWPDGLRDALNGIIADDVGIESSNTRSAATLLGEWLPRAVWLSDDVLGWVYEICSEGGGARRRKGQYTTPGWLSELVLRLCLRTLHGAGGIASDEAREHIRILDPACGSGPFLLSAARTLPELRLASQDARRAKDALNIGLENLFGLDIDRTALALADLSLGLLGYTRGFGFDVNLASFGHSDFLDRASELTFGIPHESQTASDLRQLFSRQSATTFDLVIGNPPYLGFHHHSREYRQRILKHYSVFDGKADVFYYFIERGLECLREGGVLGYVVPRYWLGADKAARLRRFLTQNSELVCLLDFGGRRVFTGTGVQVCVLILRKCRPKPSHALKVVRVLNEGRVDDLPVVLGLDSGSDESHLMRFDVPQELLSDSWVLVPPQDRLIMCAIEAAADSTLGEVASVSPGLITGLDKARVQSKRCGRLTQQGVFVLSEDEIKSLDLLPQERALVKPWVKNSQIDRWIVNDSDQYVLYIIARPDAALMPNLKRHLERFRPILERRYEIALSDRPWWRLVRPRRPEQFDGPVPKIVVPFKAAQSRFAVDYARHCCSADVYCINAHGGLLPEYLCCLLNSRLLEFYFRRIAKRMGQIYEYYAHTLFRLPIRIASMSVQRRFRVLHDEIVAEIGNERSVGRRNEGVVHELENRLNRMVCDVYGIDSYRLRSLV